MWKLVIEDDEGKRTVVHLTRDQYTVGRKEGNSIRLTERNISRDHAKLVRAEGEHTNGSAPYVLEDLESYNGVFVNGVRVGKPQEMVHGDLIQIGDYRVVIQDDALEEAPAVSAQPDPEDLKATLVPGKVRARGTMLLERPNRFVMLVGPTPGAEYPLDRDLITIGRAEEAVISVNHNSVSRMHCEIHKLAEGRYEIVDNGSSNGVRVNGSDLSRGIIEAGDIIELGDVRFRFVAAGQVFLANASDSQQLAAITDRDASATLLGKRTSIAPFVILGLLLGGVAVGALYLLTRPSTPPDVVAPLSSASSERVIPEAESIALAEAKRTVLANPEATRERLQAAIPADSPTRNTQEFRDIESKWADDVFVRAERESNHQTAVGMLKRVADSPAVTDAQRTRALQLIQTRANGSSESPAPPTPTPGSPTPGSTTGSTHGGTNSGGTSGTIKAPASTSSGTTTAPEKPGKMSPAEKASEYMRQGNYAAAKSLLLPRMKNGTASTEELGMLKAICKNPPDAACLAETKQRLGQ